LYELFYVWYDVILAWQTSDLPVLAFLPLLSFLLLGNSFTKQHFKWWERNSENAVLLVKIGFLLFITAKEMNIVNTVVDAL
jgi:hypothetical protein